LKVPDNVKVKVLELLKRAYAKKQAKASSFQALVNDVSIRDDKYDYKDLNDCSFQRTKFESVSLKTKGPTDKFTKRNPKELTAVLTKSLKLSKLP